MLFDVVVKKHYRQEAYHDVSGYELTIIRNEELKPYWWATEDEKYHIPNEFKNAKGMQMLIAESLQQKEHLKDLEQVNENTIRVVSWSSIGD